jgi:RNA polymerase sigma factor (sigma-70 family)
MKISEPSPELLQRARNGELAAIDALLLAIQPGVFNLAVRMLGNREDARDATQEILLKVTTHLATFRGDAAFSTWVYQVARNQLMTAATRTRESPEVSLEGLGEQLRAGLELGHLTWQQRMQTPEEKAAAREMAVTCTQGMLMRLDRDHRLAYVLDLVFGLSSLDAGRILDIEPAAYRKRLSRARQVLQSFAGQICGVVNPDAPCRCEKQMHALGVLAADGTALPAGTIRLRLESDERRAASDALDQVMAMSDMAAVLRAHPDYQAPPALMAGIRAVLGAYGQDSPGALN